MRDYSPLSLWFPLISVENSDLYNVNEIMESLSKLDYNKNNNT